jgi:hypothetical protein
LFSIQIHTTCAYFTPDDVTPHGRAAFGSPAADDEGATDDEGAGDDEGAADDEGTDIVGPLETAGGCGVITPEDVRGTGGDDW